MKYFVLSFSLFFLIVSCEDPIIDVPIENPEMMESPHCLALDEKSLELVTGIRFFDETGSLIGQAGNPNVTNDGPIRVYPNPNNGVIAISKQDDIEYDLFIFPCVKDTLCQDVDFNNYKFDYAIDSLYNLDSTVIGVTTQNSQLQFQSNFATGYYKLVFYSEGEDVFVENMYYDSSKTANELIDFLNSEF